MNTYPISEWDKKIRNFFASKEKFAKSKSFFARLLLLAVTFFAAQQFSLNAPADTT